MKFSLGFWEWLLVLIVIYLGVWLIDDFTGLLLSSSLALICAGILVVAYIAEYIDPSKIDRTYFKFMWAGIIAPIVVSILYIWLFDGQLSWLE